MCNAYRILYLLALVSVVDCVMLTELHLQQCLNSELMVHWVEIVCSLRNWGGGGGGDERMNLGFAVQYVLLVLSFK